MTALTNTAIASLQPGQALKDDRVPGLSVRAHAGGKSYMMYYRTRDGEERRPKIGSVGVISIAQAREIARGMLAQVSAGNDPVDEWRTAREEPTMDVLWKKCEDLHWSQGRQWDREAKRIYATHIGPALGKTRLRAVRYEDAHALHAKMKATPALANRTMAVLTKMLNLAERWGLRDIGTNPTQHVERYRENSRSRFARPVEVAALGPVLEREAPNDPSGVAFLYVMLFSGARPSEILRATPSMLDRNGDQAVLRIPNGKTGHRDVYLPAAAVAVLDRLPADRKHLVGRTTPPKDLWAKIRTEIGCPDLWMRDLRRTFATMALSNGVPIGVVGELLGHASAQTTKIYAKLMVDPAFAAATATAGKVAEMLAPKPTEP